MLLKMVISWKMGDNAQRILNYLCIIDPEGSV